jgi:hypothetical protein
MKKRLLLLIFYLCVTAGLFPQVMGDANEDGIVNVVDALVIASYYVGKTTTINISQSDVNCDGAVNIIDALRVAQYYVGLLPELICDNPTPGSLPNYVPGEILVGFYDWVTLEEADNVIRSFGLTWEPSFPTSLSIWIEVEGDPEHYCTLLESYSIVAWAELRGYSSGEPDKTYIIAHITGTQQEADELINSISGLTIVEYVIATKRGVVDVPVGDESEWVNVFAEQSIIKYATLNYIATID